MKRLVLFEHFLMLISFTLYLLCNISFPNGQIDILSITVWCLSGYLVCWGLNRMFRFGIRSYSLFSVVFFGFLHLNTYKLSGLQTDITVQDIYYWIFGGIVFLICLYIADNMVSKEKKYVFKVIKTDSFVFILLTLYWCIYGYIFATRGIRLFSGVYNNLHGEANRFTLKGFSGLASMLTLILLIYVPHVKRAYRIAILGSTFLLYGILMFSRGNCMRVFLFLVIYIFYDKTKSLFTRENIRKLCVVVGVFVCFFILFGMIRQFLRWGEDSDPLRIIHESAKMNLNLGYFVWIFGYSIINFDVLKLDYLSQPRYIPETVLIPAKRFLYGNSYYEILASEPVDAGRNYGLGGFNAATFISPYVLDMGEFFWMEILLLGSIVGCLLFYARKNGYDGLYIFLLSLVVTCVFGDYFMMPSIMYTLIVSSVLLKFTVRSSHA